MTWNDTAIDMLKRLWDAQWTASMIAGALNRQFGTEITANSVVGKVHRLKLPGRPSPIKRGGPKPRAPRLRVGRPSKPKPPTRDALPRANTIRVPVPKLRRRRVDSETSGEHPEARGVRMSDLAKYGCKFPTNTAPRPDGHLFCNAPTEGDGPYCQHHRERAWSGKPPAPTGARFNLPGMMPWSAAARAPE